MPVQNVNVVNPIDCTVDSSTPLSVIPTSAFITTVGSIKELNTAPLNSNTWVFVKPSANYYTLQISNVTVTTGGVAVNHHIGSVYYNLSQTQIEYALETILTAYHAQNSGATSVVVNYSRMGNNNQVEHNYMAYSDI